MLKVEISEYELLLLLRATRQELSYDVRCKQSVNFSEIALLYN
jgi:hypothetical protein